MASSFGEEDSSVDGCEIDVNFQLNSIISYSYEPTGNHDISFINETFREVPLALIAQSASATLL